MKPSNQKLAKIVGKQINKKAGYDIEAIKAEKKVMEKMKEME